MKRTILLSVALLGASSAYATVPEYGTFVASKACPLFSSVKKQSNPGKKSTTPNKEYKLLARNRHGGEWLRVEVKDAKPNMRWLNESCGAKKGAAAKSNKPSTKAAGRTVSISANGRAKTQAPKAKAKWYDDVKRKAQANTSTKTSTTRGRGTLSVGASAKTDVRSKPQKSVNPANKKFKPFFDDIRQSRFDYTPRAPKLNAFDDAVLKVCGQWGQHPMSSDFRVMLDKPAMQPYVESMHKRLGGKVLKSGNMKDFKNQLTAVWFARKGFEHVFCGEPDSRKLGGLHYVGRFLQMQQEDWGGPMPARDCRPRGNVGGTYAMGVSYIRRNDRVENACVKSYAYTMNAEDLLVAGAQALRNAGRDANSSSNMACMINVNDNGKNFYMRLVASRGGIRSLFPLDKPRCDKGRISRCECGN